MLAGPDRELRRAALRAVRTLPVPDHAVAAALDDAPATLRLALYRTLAQSRRQALAESLLPDVHARWGDRDAAALLPACGAETVARRLPEFAHAVTSWTALAKRHPAAIVATAELELSEGVETWSWWRRRGAGVRLAALAEPAAVLALAERHDLGSHLLDLPAAAMNALFGADAVRARKLLLGVAARSWSGMPRALLPHLRAASDPELAPEAGTYRLGRVLRSLPPGRRAALFESVAALSGGTGRWALRSLPWLPVATAAAAARSMLAWYDTAGHPTRERLDDPALPLRFTSFLPYEEAAGPLREAAVGGDPRRRGLARTLLVQCAARTRDRGVLRALLDELARRTANEQDPLRRDLLAALREVPPSLFDDSFAVTLERLSTDAADAPDSSPTTRRALTDLAGRTLRHQDPSAAPALIAWAFGVYGKLVARHGADGLPAPHPSEPSAARRRLSEERADRGQRLDQVLRTGQEHDLLAVLRPHLRAARDRADFTLAVALARALGRRGWGLAELQDDLRAAVLAAPEPLAREAADLWLTRPHRRGLRAVAGERDARIAWLVREYPDAVTLPVVWRTVARRRT
ncbi:hypothetical protein HII36_54575, partial [Nonomuraea sp. NN258]|nr:hypothetical protein [Nonomuraea antri]